jgi:predicted nucleotidyltransferase
LFDSDERERVYARLVVLAQADERIVAAALTGSLGAGRGDEWSDIDLAFALNDGVEVASIVEDWTMLLAREFGVVQHWDLPFRASLYRVFLLDSLLELDLAFVPRVDFGARGPIWRVEFGETMPAQETPRPDADNLAGLGWHHVRHARTNIARRKPFAALYMLDAARELAIELACLRLGLSTAYSRGAHELPVELRVRLGKTLPSSLDDAELLRALRETADVLADELEPRLAEIVRGFAAA